MKTQEYNPQDEQIIQMLTPKVDVKPSPDLRAKILQKVAEQKVMNKKTSVQSAYKPHRNTLQYWIGVVASMAAVIAIGLTMMLNTSAYAAKRYFSSALLATSDIRTMVMKLKVRSPKNEPIDYIDPSHDFTPATIKVIYDEPMLWSVEKENGRGLLYKGATGEENMVYQWMSGKDCVIGWKQPYEDFEADDLSIFLDPRLLLDAEYKLAEYRRGARYEIIDNGASVDVKVTTMAQGNYSESLYTLNTSLAEANTVRMYTFDKTSGRLTKMRIDMVISSELQTTVIGSESISYDEPLTATTLSNQNLDEIPFSTLDISAPKSSPLVGINARQAAKIITKAMKEWDTEILDVAMQSYKEFMPKLESIYKGMEVISIGKPVKSGLYAGQFVKCEVILPNGNKETLTLALRNDNAAKVWLLDGGL